MGSGHSTAKAAEEQKPETGTTLFGSWDKPVADAYALKKQVSKLGRVVVNKAADAAGAAAGSTFQMEAGAGVKPSGAKATSAKKGPGTVYMPRLIYVSRRLSIAAAKNLRSATSQ